MLIPGGPLQGLSSSSERVLGPEAAVGVAELGATAVAVMRVVSQHFPQSSLLTLTPPHPGPPRPRPSFLVLLLVALLVALVVLVVLIVLVVLVVVLLLLLLLLLLLRILLLVRIIRIKCPP